MARNRNNDGDGTSILVEKTAFGSLCKKHEQFKVYARHWTYNSASDAVKIPMRSFNVESMKTLLVIYQGLSETTDITAIENRKETILHLSSFVKVLENPTGAKISKLRPLEAAIIKHVQTGAIRAWVFHRQDTGHMQALLVSDVRYHPLVVHQGGGRTPAHVSMYTKYWEKGESHTKSFSWSLEEIGKTVQELFTDKGLFKEDAALLKSYDKDEAQFLEWRKMLGEQFVGKGKFVAQGEDRWSRSETDMNGSRMIIDDKCKEIKNHESTSIFDDGDGGEYNEGSAAAIEAAEKFSRMPIGFYIWCFNLTTYDGGYAHMSSLTPYVYRPELRDKLILPPEHGDLIDALTADMNVLMEDIISGKSGGTTILCQGKAGTGKTLTAEVYAEAIKRPLYRVHSGQLGTDAESVEEALKKALDNSKRWRAVLLIDEADVFVSVRGDNLEKNAVIGVFLRVLEYYDGLLFLTTNRVDDIDEAILSRCIAVIKYSIPGVEERFKIWQTLGDVYGMKIVASTKVARQLAEAFECSGRDIKGLIKLVTKYARQRKKTPEFADFKRMAAFRGL